ncbi:MAG: hypothetical protein L3J50_07705, partial [Emcibacter sp.]|nr:hypothetical protein [Emcibacter sp.]
MTQNLAVSFKSLPHLVQETTPNTSHKFILCATNPYSRHCHQFHYPPRDLKFHNGHSHAYIEKACPTDQLNHHRLKSVGSLRATEVTFFKSVPLAHSCIYNTTLKVVDLT